MNSVIPCVLAFLCHCYYCYVDANIVHPPTDVTIECHNKRNIFRWKYDHSLTGVKFNVTVQQLTKPLVWFLVDSSSMFIDLSEFSDPDDDTYMVQVSAVNDNYESEPMPEDGIQYSYFKDAQVDGPKGVICNLDLPSVNLTTENQLIIFSFTHPALLYPNSHKTRKRKSHDSKVVSLPAFTYHIEIENQSASYSNSCHISVCTGALQITNNMKSYCLNISGEMKKMSVLPTKKYCSEPLKSAGINIAVYIVPIVLLCCGLLILVMMIVKKTRATTLNPSSLTFFQSNRSNLSQALPVTSNYSSVNVEPSSPQPLLQESEDMNYPTTYTNGSADNLRLPLGIPDNQPEQEEVAEAQKNTGYTDGKCLEDDNEEEEEPSIHVAYESRN